MLRTIICQQIVLDKMDKFLETHKMPKLTQNEENLNRPNKRPNQ